MHNAKDGHSVIKRIVLSSVFCLSLNWTLKSVVAFSYPPTRPFRAVSLSLSAMNDDRVKLIVSISLLMRKFEIQYLRYEVNFYAYADMSIICHQSTGAAVCDLFQLLWCRSLSLHSTAVRHEFNR